MDCSIKNGGKPLAQQSVSGNNSVTLTPEPLRLDSELKRRNTRILKTLANSHKNLEPSDDDSDIRDSDSDELPDLDVNIDIYGHKSKVLKPNTTLTPTTSRRIFNTKPKHSKTPTLPITQLDPNKHLAPPSFTRNAQRKSSKTRDPRDMNVVTPKDAFEYRDRASSVTSDCIIGSDTDEDQDPDSWFSKQEIAFLNNEVSGNKVIFDKVNPFNFDNNPFPAWDDMKAFTKFLQPHQEYVNMVIHVYGFWRDINNFQSDSKVAHISNVVFSCLRLLSVYFNITDVVTFMSTIFKGLPAKSVLEPQSGFPSEFIDSWEILATGELSQKMTRVLVGIITCPLTKKFGLNFTEYGLDNLINIRGSKIKFTTAPELIRSSLDFIVSFANTGYECFVEKSLQPALVRNRQVREWMRDFESVMLEVTEKATNPTFSAPAVLEKMGYLSARGANLLQSYGKEIGPLWKTLMDVRLRLIKEHNVTSNRKPPFSVLIYGTPGIGKSAVVQTVATIYQRGMVKHNIYPDLLWDPQKNMYTFNVKDDFWSGYKGAQQWCILLDDIGREHVKHVAAGKITSINEIIDVVNTVGIATNQADLQDKGTIPLIPKLVIATTNTKNLNASHAVAEESAVLRRFPIVLQPILKPEYVDEETGMMKKLDTVVHDAWDFRVEKIKLIVRGDLGSEKVVTHRVIIPGADGGLMSGAELSTFLVKEALKHEKSSEVMLASNVVAKDVDVCEHDVLSYYNCKQCTLEPQAWMNIFTKKKETFGAKCKRKVLHWCVDNLPVDMYMDDVMKHYSMRDHLRVARERLNKREDRRIVDCRKAIAIFGSCTLATVLASYLYKYFKRPTLETQSAKNIWSILASNNIDFTLPTTHKSNNLEELRSSLRRGTFRIAVKHNGKTQEVTALSVREGWYVTLSHIFLSGEEWQCIASYPSVADGSYSLKSQNGFLLKKKELMFLSNDLVMFSCAGILPRKSLFQFFPKKVDKSGRNFLIFDPRTDILGHGESTGMTTVDYKTDYGKSIRGDFMNAKRLDRHPLRGDCGSVVISEAMGGYYISGIHCAGTPGGSSSRMIITQLSQNILERETPVLAMSEYVDFSIVEKGSKRSGRLMKPHESKGVHHWVQGFALPLGSYGGRVTSSSKVKRSIIHDKICTTFNYHNTLVPPLMVPEVINGKWYNPFSVAAEDQANITPHFSSIDLLECATAYVSDLKRDTGWLVDCGPVDVRVAVNGIHGDSFVNILPMSTSGGMFFPGAKSQYFHTKIDLETGEEYFMPNPEVVDVMERIIECYKLGQRACVLFNATLKDEAIKQSKRDIGKTRIFTACDVAFSIIVRMKFLKITRAIMKNNFISECAVGMNCYSQDWGALKNYLCTYGENNMIAGDYSAYDKNMPAALIRCDFYVLQELMETHEPLSYEDKLIIRGIATDIAFPVTNMNGDVIQFFGGNSSGTPLTVIINSVSNSLYIRYAYKNIIRDKPLTTFRDNVALITLGDDNAMSSALKDFNHTTISNVLREHGIPYTMADKETASVPFIHIDDVDFLKRNFRTVDGWTVGQLSEKSIFKSLTMYVDKGNISHEEQLAQCYLAARREWSLYGREHYNDRCRSMEAILEEFPGIKRFFLPQHFYSYEVTRDWVRNA